MASRSSPALALAAAALALAGCPTADVETRPFHIRATVDGQPLEELALGPAFYLVFGTGEVLGPTSLRLPDAIFADGRTLGELVISYDGTPAPGAVFDPALGGQALRVLLLVDPEATGPEGEPLPVPGFRVATGASPDFRHRIVLWEATYASPNGIATVFAPAGPHLDDPVFPDIPEFRVEAVYAAWEPAECGLVYYDALNALGETEAAHVALDHGERGRVPIGGDEPAWNVLHVQSWHRDGACAGQAQAWSQLAAWRPPAAAP